MQIEQSISDEQLISMAKDSIMDGNLHHHEYRCADALLWAIRDSAWMKAWDFCESLLVHKHHKSVNVISMITQTDEFTETAEDLYYQICAKIIILLQWSRYQAIQEMLGQPFEP